MDLAVSIAKVESEIESVQDQLEKDERDLKENLEKLDEFEDLKSTTHDDVETWKRSYQRQTKNITEKLTKISKNFLEKEHLVRQSNKQLSAVRSKLQELRDQSFEESCNDLETEMQNLDEAKQELSEIQAGVGKPITGDLYKAGNSNAYKIGYLPAYKAIHP